MIAKRDKAAARFYFDKPTRDNGAPEKTWINAVPTKQRSMRSMLQGHPDRGSTNKVPQQQQQQQRGTGASCDQARHETDARFSIPSINKNVLAGVELMYMIRDGRMIAAEGNPMSLAEQSYTLAG
ncbi:hypothetical protein ACFQAT_03120 [Undibacterium arcticum]|uniref:Uncharacterized protein n=1 Tax=Undibacterium arcticum TaxID=1762892 RepID=A0ABV7F402_9BURK